jgi:hypothetical protein
MISVGKIVVSDGCCSFITMHVTSKSQIHAVIGKQRLKSFLYSEKPSSNKKINQYGHFFSNKEI